MPIYRAQTVQQFMTAQEAEQGESASPGAPPVAWVWLGRGTWGRLKIHIENEEFI